MLDETTTSVRSIGCPNCEGRTTVEVDEEIEQDGGASPPLLVTKRVHCPECDGTGKVDAQVTERVVYPISEPEPIEAMVVDDPEPAP